jgi:hypothetical protein
LGLGNNSDALAATSPCTDSKKNAKPDPTTANSTATAATTTESASPPKRAAAQRATSRLKVFAAETQKYSKYTEAQHMAELSTVLDDDNNCKNTSNKGGVMKSVEGSMRSMSLTPGPSNGRVNKSRGRGCGYTNWVEQRKKGDRYLAQQKGKDGGSGGQGTMDCDSEAETEFDEPYV